VLFFDWFKHDVMIIDHCGCGAGFAIAMTDVPSRIKPYKTSGTCEIHSVL